MWKVLHNSLSWWELDFYWLLIGWGGLLRKNGVICVCEVLTFWILWDPDGSAVWRTALWSWVKLWSNLPQFSTSWLSLNDSHGLRRRRLMQRYFTEKSLGNLDLSAVWNSKDWNCKRYTSPNPALTSGEVRNPTSLSGQGVWVSSLQDIHCYIFKVDRAKPHLNSSSCGQGPHWEVETGLKQLFHPLLYLPAWLRDKRNSYVTEGKRHKGGCLLEGIGMNKTGSFTFW